MLFNQYPGLRNTAAVSALVATLAVAACKPNVGHPVEPLHVDDAVFVYAHGAEGFVPVNAKNQEQAEQVFQDSWSRFHEVTGLVPESVTVRRAGELSLDGLKVSAEDICDSKDRRKMRRQMASAAEEKYDIHPNDLLIIMLQTEPGFACGDSLDEHGHEESHYIAVAPYYDSQIIVFDSEKFANPAHAKSWNHEFGHALLDLTHNNRLDCPEEYTIVFVGADCVRVNYGDKTTVMGGGTVSGMGDDNFFNAFEYRRLGKIDEDQIVTKDSRGVHDILLHSLKHSDENGVKIVRVPLDRNDLGREFYGMVPTNAIYLELNHIAMPGTEAEQLRLRSYLVHEDVIQGGKRRDNYLLNPQMGSRDSHELKANETVTFAFNGLDVVIEVQDIHRNADKTAGAADVRLTLR